MFSDSLHHLSVGSLVVNQVTLVLLCVASSDLFTWKLQSYKCSSTRASASEHKLLRPLLVSYLSELNWSKYIVWSSQNQEVMEKEEFGVLFAIYHSLFHNNTVSYLIKIPASNLINHLILSTYLFTYLLFVYVLICKLNSL